MDMHKQRPFTPKQGGRRRLMSREWWWWLWCQRAWRGNQFVLQRPTGTLSAGQLYNKALDYALKSNYFSCYMFSVNKVNPKWGHWVFCLFVCYHFLNLELGDNAEISANTCVESLFAWIVRNKNNQSCTAKEKPQRPSFLFVKPSVEVRARNRQEVLAFPESLLWVKARHGDRDGPTTTDPESLGVYKCYQSDWLLMRQNTSHPHDNASGPVPCLTIHNPLLAVSVRGSLADPCSTYPGLWAAVYIYVHSLSRLQQIVLSTSSYMTHFRPSHSKYVI